MVALTEWCDGEGDVGAAHAVGPGRVDGERDRADQGGIGGEPGGNELRRERYPGGEGVLQGRPQPVPGPDHAAAHRYPHRVQADREVDDVVGEFGGEIGEEAVQPGDVAARLEDLAGRHRLAVGGVTGRPAGQGLPADHVLQRRPGGQRDADVGHGAQVVADFAGRPVHPGQYLATGHDGGREPGAKVQVDGRVIPGQGTPAHLGLGRRLRVSDHDDPRPRERVTQLVPERELVPAADRGGEFDPVVEGDPEGGDADRGEAAPGGGARQQGAGGLDAALEAGPGTELATAGDGRRCEPLAARLAHHHGDLRATEVKPEHNRGLGHV